MNFNFLSCFVTEISPHYELEDFLTNSSKFDNINVTGVFMELTTIGDNLIILTLCASHDFTNTI